MSIRPNAAMFLFVILTLSTLAGTAARATMLTWIATDPAQAGAPFDNSNYDPTIWTSGSGPDTVIAPLFTAPGAGGFSDYGNNVSGATQTGKGPGGAYTYSYGTDGGPTPDVSVSYGSGAGTVPTTIRSGGNTISSDETEGMYISTLNFYPVLPVAQTYFNDNNLHRVITLTTDSNHLVSLQSFSVDDEFPNSTGTISFDVVSIDDSNNETVLWSATNVTYNTATLATENFGPALMGQRLGIDFQETGGYFFAAADVFGFADIQFGEVAPEPASAALLAVGSLLILRRRHGNRIRNA